MANDKETGEPETTKQDHATLAKRANIETWKLLQKATLTEQEKSLVLYSAFASAFHWSVAGMPTHMQRAEWLISRAYTKLNMGNSALLHAKKCLSLTNAGDKSLEDFDFAYAFEAMARAYALAGDFENASSYYQKAVDAAKNIEDAEDKKIFLSDLKGGNWNGFSWND